ncbi:hypothetical protein FACS1894204_12750 [Synergistales bacterium]|nr:hypothetical protein FACS1894204_12750 [Synergistales bacterium]
MFSASLSNRKDARSGFILLSVLLLSVVLISCATAFAWFARMHIRSVLREKTSLENRTMAQVMSRSIISGIRSIAFTDYDSPLLPWFEPFSIPMNDALWTAQVVPLDDKIPIRNIFLPDNSTIRGELRTCWDNMWDKMEVRGVSDIVLDFMDKDTRARREGAELETHIQRYPLDMSEFLILEEITPEILYGSAGATVASESTAPGGFGRANEPMLGLADYCTLWSGGKINMNVAPVHVMEILPGMDNALALKVAERREQEPLKDMSDLRDISGFPPRTATILMNLADFKSQYFMIKFEMIESGGGSFGYSVIFDKKTGLVVRWEEI